MLRRLVEAIEPITRPKCRNSTTNRASVEVTARSGDQPRPRSAPQCADEAHRDDTMPAGRISAIAISASARSAVLHRCRLYHRRAEQASPAEDRAGVGMKAGQTDTGSKNAAAESLLHRRMTASLLERTGVGRPPPSAALCRRSHGTRHAAARPEPVCIRHSATSSI